MSNNGLTPPVSDTGACSDTRSNGLTQPFLVSVIIPTYNSSAFLHEAVDSVLAQTYPAVEVVVVNDGSTDDTENVLKAYGDRITAITQTNAGTSAARNTGVTGSRGCYIAFLDHDDLWKPTKLEIQMAVFEDSPELGMVYCGRQFFNHYTGQVTSIHPAEPEMDIHDLLAMKAIALQSVVVPRKVLDEVGLFDTSISGADDWEMCLRIVARYSVRGVPDILVDIRGHEHQQSMRTEYMYSKIMSVFERYRGVHGTCSKCRQAISSGHRLMHESFYQRMLGSAKTAFRERKYMNGMRMLLRGIKENPHALLRIPRRLGERLFTRSGGTAGSR